MRLLPLGLSATVAVCLLTPAHAVIDRNADQLSDVWAQRFGAPAFSAATDSDADGFTNLQESILGTDPFNRASALTQSLAARADGTLDLAWPARAAKLYHLETSPDLVTWTPVATFTGTDADLATTLPADGAPRRFTRIIAEDPPDTDGDGLTDWEERAAGTNPARMFSEGLGSNPTTPTTSNPRITDFERVRDALVATTNTITLFAVDSAMDEAWPDPGVVVVRRTGRLDPVTVNLSLGGTATSGFDYATPPFLSVTLPFGADEATFSLTPLTDALNEGPTPETITVTLQAGAGYSLGTTTSATLTITDDAAGRVPEKAAARFLTQATFGPTPAELARVRDLGFAAWLDDQFARPINLHLPLVQIWQTELNGTTSSDSVTVEHRMEAWWRQTMRDDVNSDPLRQRVAFALSQIFVISDRMTSLNDDQRGMTAYQDILLTNAFGTYRSLLEAVTRSPWMGLYLSALRNRKANPALNRFPDENYAREVMQLFSIGLWLLNPDGTFRLSTGADLDPDGAVVPAGEPIPTYGETQIGVMARVFTGLSYSTRFTSGTNLTEIPTTRFSDSFNIPWQPMRMFDAEHDLAAKTLALPGMATLSLPARVASSPDTGTAGNADLAAALDHLANHPNIAPFICRQLIQRLVTSNPSPAYVGRISAVFADNGSGVRGDLRAVIRALLLDPEARAYEQTLDPVHGLVREPYTRYVAFARAFSAAPADPASSGGRYRGFGGLDADLLQRPLSAPSVFNFYSPFYRPPGLLDQAQLVAPELQIVNSVTAITGPNRFSSALSVTNTTPSTTSNSGWTQINSSVQSDNTNTADVNEALWNTRIDETAWVSLAQGSPESLVSALDRTLCNGAMSAKTFRAITRALRRLDDPAAAGLTDAVRETRARQRFRVAAHLVLISADAAVLK
jgi:uncharacterized protein (DUF1800 family)